MGLPILTYNFTRNPKNVSGDLEKISIKIVTIQKKLCMVSYGPTIKYTYYKKPHIFLP